MQALGLLGVAVFALASAVVGVRLLLLARRTRQAPELAMGIAFLVSGAFGFPLLTAASVVVQADGSAPLAHALVSLGAFSTFAGYVGLGIGCWRIHRPRARWPLAPIGLGTAVVLAASAVVATSSGTAGAGARDLAFWCGVAVGVLTFAWNALESFVLHGRLRRRAALGLADPEVVDRVWLWGVGSAAACAMALHGLVLRAAIGPVVTDGQRVVSSLLGLVAAVAISLAFFPPAAYRRRFAAAAERAGDA
jgi:hypothetical protein